MWERQSVSSEKFGRKRSKGGSANKLLARSVCFVLLPVSSSKSNLKSSKIMEIYCALDTVFVDNF